MALCVFDVSGRLVRTVLREVRPAGRHQVVWDGRDAEGRIVASGVYFYRLETAERTETRTTVRIAP